MTDTQQTEIELPEMPLPPELPADDQPPAEAVKRKDMAKKAREAGSFTVLTSLPFRFFDSLCCTQFGAELWQDEYDQAYVTYTHADDCDVWRFV